jgi:hypothetical protein
MDSIIGVNKGVEGPNPISRLIVEWYVLNLVTTTCLVTARVGEVELLHPRSVQESGSPAIHVATGDAQLSVREPHLGSVEVDYVYGRHGIAGQPVVYMLLGV